MRLATWEENLATAMEAALQQPFRWGEHDCATFAALCVLAVTGRDLAPKFRGFYRTQRQAGTMLDMFGGFERALNAWFEPVPQRAACIGDLGLTAVGGLCVHAGPNRWVAPAHRGLAVERTANIVKSWRVV